MAKLVGKGVRFKSGRPHYRSPPRSFKKLSQNRKRLQNVVAKMNQRLPRALADTNKVVLDSFRFSSHSEPEIMTKNVAIK